MATKDINKAISSITKASDCREDTVMLFQGNSNWEEYLSPAPISIAFLGELVFISAKKDFSIKDGASEKGFEFLKYPDSFRACLMQVCNLGWGAFNEAHKSMDKIYLHTKNVPEYIKMAVKILLQDDDRLVESILPDTLESIADISKDCVSLATSVENKFLHVSNVISELLETCISSKQHYGKRLDKVRRMMVEENLKKEMLEEESKQAQEQFHKLGKQVEEANANFQKAMDSIPSGWDAIAMDFVEGISQSVTSLMSLKVLRAASAGDHEISQTQSDASANPAHMCATSEVVTKSPMLLATADALNTFIQGDEILWSEVTDLQTGESKCDWLEKRIEDVRSRMEDVDECPAKTEFESICEESIAICNNLKAVVQEGNQKDKNNKMLIKKIKALFTAAKKFDSSSKKATNTPAVSGTPPAMMKAQSRGSASQMATNNAHFKIEQMKMQLDQSRDQYEKSLERTEKKKRELADTLNKLRNSDVEKIDFETTIELLATGLQAMGSLQEKWRKMVQFFQMVSNIIETCLTTSLNDFVKTAKKPRLSNMPYTSKMFMRDMIYQQAFKASDIANMVNMISGTYTEISNKYLMDRVSSLGRLMTLDPKDHSFQTERVSLQTSCDEAEKSIQQLVLKNKELYKSKTKARRDRIETELRAALPPPSEEEMKETREIVAAGFQVDPEDMDQFA